MILDVLRIDDSHARFEKFCVEIFSVLDGVDYVPTSSTWDLGRDGRQASLFNTDIFPLMCCSLNERASAKAKKDLKRLLTTTDLASIRFCSSQPLTEHVRDKIRGDLKGLAQHLESVAVEGAEQIATIIRRNSKCTVLFEQHYPGEIANERAVRAASEDGEDAHISGMRIALSTQLTDDGESLREDLVHNLILTSLSDGRARSRAGIARLLSEALYLGRSVQEGYILPALTQLATEGSIKKISGSYVITIQGLEAVEERSKLGAEMSGEGERQLRSAIKELSGHTLPDGEYSQIWKIVMEELSELLYLNGMQTIDALASLAHQRKQGIVGQFDLIERIERIAGRIRVALGQTPISKDIGQAIVDAFNDSTSLMFDWFTKLCACYTAICALGLSEESQSALVRRLRKLDLFLDTDIALFLVAEGEPDHDRVTTLIEGWQRVGGSINVARPVLEELAYHAYISETDFREVYHQLPSYSEPEARRLITNAFVRGYWAATKRLKAAFNHKTWREYIANFRGTSDTDYSRIAEDLRSNKVVPAADERGNEDLAKTVGKIIMDMKLSVANNSTQTYNKKFKDKSDRDGRFVAGVIAYRQEKEAADGTAVIVSSSPLLAKVCHSTRLSLGEDPLVLSVAALAYFYCPTF